jgi:LysM repeat protein
LSLFVFHPLLANAGFFSLSVLFGETNSQIKAPETIKKELNSQNVPLLQAAINIDPDPAKGGADINTIDGKALVAESGVGGSFVEISERRNTSISLYEVKPGDTLSQIADMFDVSTNTIRWANDFEGAIQPGQKLVILPISGLTHTVKNGGTVADIAEIYEGDAREIALFNGITVDKYLEPGEVVIVPNAIKESEHKNTNSSTSVASGSSGGSSYSSTWLVRPISGGYKSQGIHGYNAVDLAGKTGQAVFAAAEGKVIVAKSSGWNGGYGLYVVIEHPNGVQTLYSHLSSVSVKQGEWVGQGNVIGGLGNTGRSTGPHLHFEVRGAKNPF